MTFLEHWPPYAQLVVTVYGPDGPVEISPDFSGGVGLWPSELPSPIHVMTAWDPGSERPGLEINQERQRDLESELQPLVTGLWRARGRSSVAGTDDEGVAVAGLRVDDAISIARSYRQDAIFEWTPERWSIVPCNHGRRLDSGWALSSTEAPTT
ncbi:MAG TPA: DUF3293 domain-containing protein [Acidimicrobiales bacterium]